MMTSIKRQLLVLIMSVFVTGVIGFSITTYYELKEEMDELFDKNMQQVADAIAVHNLSTQGIISPPQLNGRTKLKSEEEFLIQIWQDEHLLYSSLPPQPFPYQGPGGVHTVRFENQKWRYYGLKHGEKWLIQVSQPIALRHTVIWEIYFQLLIPLLIQFPIIVALIWYIIRRGFTPLTSISSLIERRGESNLTPLPNNNAPAEISVMIDAINGLLHRLNHALNTQRQFTADAAHELRTPLTAVRLELDLLKRSDTVDERERSIRMLFNAVDRCTHLVQQLIELARQEPSVTNAVFSNVDLASIANDVVTTLTPLALDKNISITLNCPANMFVTAHPASLHILVTNLLENALLYTQDNGNVAIEIKQNNNEITFLVADDGPGIPTSERIRIFDRFYRVLNKNTSHVNGSGLGLAIVKAIADQHKIPIRMTDGLNGRGVGFEITFTSDKKFSE